MSPLSTLQVAALVGIHRTTLELWIQQGKVRPKTISVGGRNFRIWTEHAIEKVRRVKKKTYRKGRGRKKKTQT